MSELDCHIKRENDKLRVAGIRVTILQRGNWLYLRAVLPPKLGTGKVKPHRQEYTPKPAGLPANAEGIKRTTKLAKKLWNAVESDSFDWEVWSGKPAKAERTAKEWIEALKPYWLDEGSQGKCSEKTWERHWQVDFDKLPQDLPLTSALLLDRVLQIQPNTRRRRQVCYHLQKLADCHLEAHREWFDL